MANQPSRRLVRGRLGDWRGVARGYVEFGRRLDELFDDDTDLLRLRQQHYLPRQQRVCEWPRRRHDAAVLRTGQHFGGFRAQAAAPADGDWLPLGVFALTKTGDTNSVVTIELAVNKQGVIRGNYTDTKTDKTQLIQGSVDKQTQRVAFTVGDNKSNLIETGLYNLTKDEAPALIHVGADQTEQWLLVRLKQSQDATGQQTQ